MGTHPHPVRHMWNPTWRVRTNAASLLPDMVHVLDGLGDMVERLVPPRPSVAATHHERWLCARLLIPHTLVGIFPQQERHKFRSVVGLFQFRALQGVHELRR